MTRWMLMVVLAHVGCGDGGGSPASGAPTAQRWSMSYSGAANGSVTGRSAQVSGLASAPNVALQISALDIVSDRGARLTLNTTVLNRFTLEFPGEGLSGCVAEPLDGQPDPQVELTFENDDWISGTFEGTLTCDGGGTLSVSGDFDAEKIAVIGG